MQTVKKFLRKTDIVTAVAVFVSVATVLISTVALVSYRPNSILSWIMGVTNCAILALLWLPRSFDDKDGDDCDDDD